VRDELKALACIQDPSIVRSPPPNLKRLLTFQSLADTCSVLYLPISANATAV